MPKKDGSTGKEVKEKGSTDRVIKKETPVVKQVKGREKDSMEKALKKDPSTSKETKVTGSNFSILLIAPHLSSQNC